MSPAETPVANTELLLRRVPSHPGYFTFPDGPLLPSAFLPSERDKDGISLFRQSDGNPGCPFFTPDSLLEISTSNKVRLYGGVVAIAAEAIREISPLTIALAPAEGLPGHVIIPEINYLEYKGEGKRRIKALADLLARASEVVRTPHAIPDEN